MKLSTINILEINGPGSPKIFAFPNNKKGEGKAKKLFRKLVKKDAPDLTEEEIENELEAKEYYEYPDAYSIYYVISTK